MTQLVDASVPEAEVKSRSRRRVGALWLSAAVVTLVIAALISWATVDVDTGANLLALVRSTAVEALHLRWQYAAVVIVLAALHYLATAVATRAAAGTPLPLGETLVVQLAGAAANRVTPAGIGGSAVTARYLARRGLDTVAAVGAVALLAVVSAIADLLLLCALLVVGGWFGLKGTSHEISFVAGHVSAVLGSARSPLIWVIVGAAFLVLAVIALRHRRVAAFWQRLCQPARTLIRRPAMLATLVIASGSTTLILAFAFVASTAMVPGPAPSIGLGALIVAFMLASAIGSAVPTPAGLGSSEAAFIAVLLSAHLSAPRAVEIVLIYRLLTFWAPAVAGVFAVRWLRRRNAI